MGPRPRRRGLGSAALPALGALAAGDSFAGRECQGLAQQAEPSARGARAASPGRAAQDACWLAPRGAPDLSLLTCFPQGLSTATKDTYDALQMQALPPR